MKGYRSGPQTDVPIAGLDERVNEDARKALKRHKETERKAAKRKRDGNKLLELHVPIVYEPVKYLLYDAPPNTVGYSVVKYLRNLQQNDTVP